MSAVVSTQSLSFRYGAHPALDGVDLSVAEGSVYALLGPNGSGKTTFIKLLLGLLRPSSGSAFVLGKRPETLTSSERADISYVAEGQQLPGWMRLRELESYLAPLYPRWDRALADSLRGRFSLDPGKLIRGHSRGERMKAALLCALAPRPRLLLMDEPFTGMDVMVKDDIVRGVLESAGSEGWTVLISSHDLGEVETIADGIGILRKGKLIFSESMEGVQNRFHHVEVMMPDDGAAKAVKTREGWLHLANAGPRLQFIDSVSTNGATEAAVRREIPGAVRVEVRPASLREVFVAVVRQAEREKAEAR